MNPAVRPKVLVLDDEPLMRRALRAALTEAGFDVAECGDGDTAKLLLERHALDAVIFEVHVPPFQARELVAAARAIRPDLVVVACCGHLAAPRIRELLDAGADAFVPKIDLTVELVAILHAQLAKRRGAGADSDGARGYVT